MPAKCRTCKHCEIYSKTQGSCHAQPPVLFHSRWIKADGKHRVPMGFTEVRPGQFLPSPWIQLVPSYLASAYPPVNPQKRGCGHWWFSIRTTLRYWRSEKTTDLPSPVQQEKSE